MFLQKPTDSMLQEYILRQGEILIGEHLRCKSEKILHDKVNTFHLYFSTQLYPFVVQHCEFLHLITMLTYYSFFS